MHAVLRCAATLALLALPLPAQLIDAAGLPNELGRSYGFSGLQVSRFNDGLTGLVAGDLDGDGGDDLALINNARSRIELLLRPRAGEAVGDGTTPDPGRVNELADESWWRRESVAIEEKVGSLELFDLDGDGRCEVLFTGDSGRLTLAWHGVRGGQARSVQLRLPGDAGAAHVAAGDVDGDGRPDALVCGKHETWIFRQQADGSFAEPQSVPLATDEPDSLELLDLDGDRRLDLLLARYESEWPLRWRLGLGAGRFGEERAAHLQPLRACRFGDADGDGRPEALAVRRQSGRVTLLRWRAPEAAGGTSLPAPAVVPFEPVKDAEKRDVLLADLDGDGADDLLAAEPGAARLLLFRGAQGAPAVFPALLGAGDPRVLHLPGGGRRLVLAAPDEGAIGLCELSADGSPSFPRALPLPPVGEGGEGSAPELLALDVAPVAPGEADAIWALLAAGKGRARTYALVRLDAEGRVLSSAKVENVKTDPKDLLVADLDRDGRNDALLCLPTELPKILLGLAEGGWRDLNLAQSPGLGLLKGVERDALWWGDVDGDGAPELLAPGPNFARAFHLDAAGVPVVAGQYNLPDPAAQVACVAAADVDGDGRPEIVLADRAEKALLVLRRDGDAAVLAARAELGELVPRGLRVARGSPARLVLLAADRFGLLAGRTADATFLPDLDFEVPVKDAYVNDLGIADVNGDGVTDLVMTETHRHELVIARVRPEALDFALRFPVYDERLFESGRSGQEPREVVLAELTGDGLVDVAILVHDRLIVYPQEAPP